MKIVLLGSNGQLGKELKNNLSEEVIKCFSKDEIDITNFSLVENMIKKEKPDILINAAAYTQVDKAETNEEIAFSINSKAVENIAKHLSNKGGYLVHFSTDYVFNGTKKTSYTELDKTSPINIYGRSKLEGEKNIQKNMENFFILRTSWVIGEHGNNFAKTILKLLKERKYLKVINDQFGVPTSTKLLSKITEAIISDVKNSKNFSPGIYNVSPRGKTTWYQMSKIILSKAIQKNIIFSPEDITIDPIETIDYPTAAKRPRNSLLNTKKISSLLNFEIPNWEDDFNQTLNKILN